MKERKRCFRVFSLIISLFIEGRKYMMMESHLYLAIALLLVSSINGRVIDDVDNSIQSTNNIDDNRDWVEISLSPPPKLIQHAGNSIELECEVTGSPQPTIHWIRGKNQRNIVDNVDSNTITETSPNSLIRVRSRLIIERSSSSERVFTCVGRAGSKTAYESTTVYSTPGHKSHNMSEFLSLNSGAKKARIVMYYSVLFDTIGTDVVLPCKAAGRPSPDIYWLDPEENIISGRDHRLRIHPSGSLYIGSLRWSDMGSFTCIAKNALDKDSVSTFVYPIMNDDEEK